MDLAVQTRAGHAAITRSEFELAVNAGDGNRAIAGPATRSVFCTDTTNRTERPT